MTASRPGMCFDVQSALMDATDLEALAVGLSSASELIQRVEQGLAACSVAHLMTQADRSR
ncbi:hypothetical protein [Gordonia effusa]|uniref:hypothetical protein n=1 Tax=Gordonia effusa TaxID=263908 RepID=UPI00110FCBF4|nr:hypothetical protein [Gordonia effusa]